MPKKPGTLNRFNVHEFLNKYEKRDLKNRDAHAESEVRRHPEFTCECGSRELVDLRPGFGECRECKAPYILEDDGRNGTRGRWAQTN